MGQGSPTLLCDRSKTDEFTYNFLTEFFLLYDNLPIWFHRLISFNFAWRNVPVGGASPASAVQNYLYDRTISMSLVGVQALTSFPAQLAKMDSRATRLLELREALELAGRDQPPALGEERSNVAVRNLTLATPNRVTLAEGLTFQVDKGAPILITGPNGAGKTALARVLLGLWNTSGRDMQVSVPRSLSIVPQRPYLAPGCLGDQVTYPKRFRLDQDAGQAGKALSAVGLEHLLERQEHGWNAYCAWEEVLSGGEQQRLALSRALFHQPDFALLDECTSMVAADAEERLYDGVTAAGVTPLTMSQRLFLPKLHKQELRLGVDSASRWSLAQLQNGSG
ncbi:ABCD1 [Symbiodinium natans]|uniref:ABCD1 protein n=1 Tax=Symbiodinium natans TaxID=878477 RepID=A0A812GP73_9DINO|nr:ABCD1 [Symbiodinium natans]